MSVPNEVVRKALTAEVAAYDILLDLCEEIGTETTKKIIDYIGTQSKRIEAQSKEIAEKYLNA